MNKNRMYYDQAQDQWQVDLQGGGYALHCGEIFRLCIGRKSVPCRLELASKWYVVMENTRFDLRENDQYMVIL